MEYYRWHLPDSDDDQGEYRLESERLLLEHPKLMCLGVFKSWINGCCAMHIFDVNMYFNRHHIASA